MDSVRPVSFAEDSEGGFTLIEILIVIIILGILASIVVFAVQSLGGKTAITSCKADFKTVENASAAFDAQVGHYPDVAKSDSAAATPGGTPIAGGLNSAPGAPSHAGIYALFTPQTGLNGTGQVGPWLKDAPINGNHYTIVLSSDGRGTVLVTDAAGVNQTSCSGVQ